MNAYQRQMIFMCAVTLAIFPVLAWAQATTQPAAGASAKTSAAPAVKADGMKVGHVRGNNVYVRSGFNQNYYPVTKLNRGDEVVILGEEFGWMKIKPPVGTHSLVEKGYVDKVNETTGTINERVWVQAGSNLNDRRYAKQVQLVKGSRVKLIGETADGAFYKIEPPNGAELWIKSDLVDQTGRLAGVAGSTGRTDSALEPVKPGELNLNDGGVATADASESKAKTPASTAKVDRASMMDRNKYQMDINGIEALIEAEGTKPLNARSYEAVISKLQVLADQSEDETAQIYAKTRIDQLQGQMELVAAVSEIGDLKEKTIDEADRLAAIRARIKAREADPVDDTIVRGEIRVSGLYDGAANRPKRWRVVAPSGTPDEGRTLAYIELAPGSPIDPVQYYGKYVGIRASGRRMLGGTIPPVPIYTIQEITVQDRATAAKRSAQQQSMGSPKPNAVKAPTSQPAATKTDKADVKPATAGSAGEPDKKDK